MDSQGTITSRRTERYESNCVSLPEQVEEVGSSALDPYSERCLTLPARGAVATHDSGLVGAPSVTSNLHTAAVGCITTEIANASSGFVILDTSPAGGQSLVLSDSSVTDIDPENHARDPSASKSSTRGTQQDARATAVRHVSKTSRKSSARRAQRQDDRKCRNKIPSAMQMQWRIGAAPSMALTLSREEKQMSKILSQAVAYHTSMFEVIWGPNTLDNQYIYDMDNRVEVFRDSSVTAASLFAAGKQTSAKKVLDKLLSGMDDLLQSQHPSLYLILAELCLDLVKTPSDALRNEIKRSVQARALATLGPVHPISQLLQVQLPLARKNLLGEKLWNEVHPILASKFGPDHYQSSTQKYVEARNLASMNGVEVEKAVQQIEELIRGWSQLYGNNSLIVCYAKIELANILINGDTSIKAELVVSDALRTSDMILAAELRNEDCHASEKRHRRSSIAFPRIAGYRTLGRLHSLKGNYGAAAHYCCLAVEIGHSSLGQRSAVVELAQAELESMRNLEKKQTKEKFPVADLANLANILPSPIC